MRKIFCVEWQRGGIVALSGSTPLCSWMARVVFNIDTSTLYVTLVFGSLPHREKIIINLNQLVLPYKCILVLTHTATYYGTFLFLFYHIFAMR